MKRLLLMRHAKAEPATDTFADSGRRLAERGERDARHVAERMHGQLGAVDLIIASPATRTAQTAELVAAVVGYDRSAIALERRLYLAEAAALIEVIAHQAASVDRLLVVGHNPGLTELVHTLLPRFATDDLPTSAIVALEYEALADWAGFAAAPARFAYYDFPKNRSEPLKAR